MDSTDDTVPHHETPSLGNPDLPPEGEVNTLRHPQSTQMTGPQNPAVASQFPNQIDAPGTDISTQAFFWSSFNISPRRVQDGGWAREVTKQDFAISDEIAGVNMYLESGGIRELHWHQTAEWAVMTRGRCRVTTLSRSGMPSVEDVEEGDLWFFPAGTPHSLQGLGPDGAEFVLAFDDGDQSESNTLLLTDWFAHTPPDVLAKNFGVAQETFADIPLHNLWIFPGDEPGPLAKDQEDAGVEWGASEPIIFRLSRSKPLHRNSGGSIQIADSTNFPLSQSVAAALVTVEPGSMRELHWHPNADEWQYVVSGDYSVTLFGSHGRYRTETLSKGDVAYIPQGYGHSIENIGGKPGRILIGLNTGNYQAIDLSQWMAGTPSYVLADHFGKSDDVFEQFPKARAFIAPPDGMGQREIK